MFTELYLSKLYLNLRSREVRRDLSDCMAMHRTVMSAFPSGLSPDGRARAEAAALFRVEPVRDGRIILLVQSALSPDWCSLPASYLTEGVPPETKPIGPALARLQAGMPLRFRLIANPTRKIGTKSTPDGRKNNGKRVELRGEDACLDWLRRKAAQHGFSLKSVSASPEVPGVSTSPQPKWSGTKSTSDSSVARMTFGGVAFEGLLEVVDPEIFVASVRSGLGSGKAYGFGLLSLAPPA